MKASRGISNLHSPRGREMKAAATDDYVKDELAAKQARDSAKIARLKSLRLAKLAADTKPK
jgi:hypothetical protein